MTKVFLSSDSISEKAEVTFVHYMPFDEVDGMGKSEEELNQIGIVVEVPKESVESDTIFEAIFGVPRIVGNTSMRVFLNYFTLNLFLNMRKFLQDP